MLCKHKIHQMKNVSSTLWNHKKKQDDDTTLNMPGRAQATQQQGTKKKQFFLFAKYIFIYIKWLLDTHSCLNMSTFIFSNYLNIRLKSFKFF